MSQTPTQNKKYLTGSLILPKQFTTALKAPPMPTKEPEVSMFKIDDFEVVRLLGRGAFGQVFLAL